VRTVSHPGQRRIPLKHTSFRGLLALPTTSSGAQEVESQLDGGRSSWRLKTRS